MSEPLDIAGFIDSVKRIHSGGHATEHSYRPALETLFNALGNDITALNEPKRVKCGAPDFLIQRGEIAIGHVEAKDINVDLRNMEKSNDEQKTRYRNALSNLIYTNCLDWDFYRNGELIASVTIGDLLLGIQPKPEQYETLESLLRDFTSQRPQTITSPQDLAKRMAGKAILIKVILHNALIADEDESSELFGQYKAFQEQLIQDIKFDEFADLYAETIAYGMFAARLHDTTLNTFTRREASELLPKSNPFLRNLFVYLAGSELDDRIVWVIDDLAEVFQAANVAEIMRGFGKLTGQNDPFLHFYETFLAAYNPAKRKARGVWYTPEPVVNFIVRAVDNVLQNEFALPLGLADVSKVTIDWDTGQTAKRKKSNIKTKSTLISKEVHRVQILDPATGTGTFLAEVIKQVAPKIQGIAPGKWSGYLEESLIPRLHGFELLMASYAMCHMKIDMILTELGYMPSTSPPRLSVYLTNSLEEGEREVQDLFMAQWLTREAREANTIKRQTPIMCVIGNPPYSGVSQNKGEWIDGLIEAYKVEPGGKEKLKERKHWLNDDYVKFIRLSESLIERTGEGVLGFVTNHGYLENPTFRGMRWRLMQTFDKIYVIDLHGNANKKETSPDGSPDRNVFDIQQGVAIIIAVKLSKGKEANECEVYRQDLWGDREGKYKTLRQESIGTMGWTKLQPILPHLAFVQRTTDASYQSDECSFSIRDFMPVNSIGMVSARDKLSIDFGRDALWKRIQDFADLPQEAARKKYDLRKDVMDWKVGLAQDDVKANFGMDKIIPISYRPFDTRWAYYTGNTRGIMARPCTKVMRHLIQENIGLVCTRNIEGGRPFTDAFVVDHPITLHSLSIKESNTLFPLYLYGEGDALSQTRMTNFEPALLAKMKELAREEGHPEPSELEVFDYIYGVLHYPQYRNANNAFLKTDFPRIPWPESPQSFRSFSDAGAQLRKLHLMEPGVVGGTTFPYLGDGDDIVSNAHHKDNRVYVNESQYFDNVPPEIWEYSIGSYQPAQKWLKDRKGRTLSFDDIQQYQRILKVLAQTDQITASMI